MQLTERLGQVLFGNRRFGPNDSRDHRDFWSRELCLNMEVVRSARERVPFDCSGAGGRVILMAAGNFDYS